VRGWGAVSVIHLENREDWEGWGSELGQGASDEATYVEQRAEARGTGAPVVRLSGVETRGVESARSEKHEDLCPLQHLSYVEGCFRQSAEGDMKQVNGASEDKLLM
jgi:hypothetical protein